MHFLNTIVLAGAIFVTAITAAPAPDAALPNCWGVFNGAVSFYTLYLICSIIGTDKNLWSRNLSGIAKMGIAESFMVHATKTSHGQKGELQNRNYVEGVIARAGSLRIYYCDLLKHGHIRSGDIEIESR
jgi:hypothetical protein